MKTTAGYRVIHRVSKNTCGHCRCFFHVWHHRETILSCLPWKQEKLKTKWGQLKSSKINVWCEHFNVHQVLIYVCILHINKWRYMASLFFFQFKEKGIIPLKLVRGGYCLPSALPCRGAAACLLSMLLYSQASSIPSWPWASYPFLFPRCPFLRLWVWIWKKVMIPYYITWCPI